MDTACDLATIAVREPSGKLVFSSLVSSRSLKFLILMASLNSLLLCEAIRTWSDEVFRSTAAVLDLGDTPRSSSASYGGGLASSEYTILSRLYLMNASFMAFGLAMIVTALRRLTSSSWLRAFSWLISASLTRISLTAYSL